MSSRSANVMARVEPEIKDQAEGIISQLGLTASTAINVFYRQIIQERALPFKPRVIIWKTWHRMNGPRSGIRTRRRHWTSYSDIFDFELTK